MDGVDFESYLERLASPLPIPAGSSAATLVSAAGAALVARVIAANPKYDGHHALAKECIARRRTRCAYGPYVACEPAGVSSL